MQHLKLKKINIGILSKSKFESFLDISTELLPEDDDGINSESSDITFEPEQIRSGVSFDKLSTSPNRKEDDIQLKSDNSKKIYLRNTINVDVFPGAKCEENALKIQSIGNSEDLLKSNFDYKGREHSTNETNSLSASNGLRDDQNISLNISNENHFEKELEGLRKRGTKPKNLDIQPKRRGRRPKMLNKLEDKKSNGNSILNYYSIQYIRRANNSEKKCEKNKKSFKKINNKRKYGSSSKRFGKRKSLTDKNISTNAEGILKYFSVKNKDIKEHDNLKAPVNKNTLSCDNTQSFAIKNSSTISEQKNIPTNFNISDNCEKQPKITEEASSHIIRESSLVPSKIGSPFRNNPSHTRPKIVSPATVVSTESSFPIKELSKKPHKRIIENKAAQDSLQHI